jgi:general secretion pathway protein K
MPQRVDQLVWLGLPARTVTALRPYLTLLPYRTKVNINTASAEVIHASVPGLDLADARRMLTARESAHFATTSDARLPAAVTSPSGNSMLTVTSDFFEVRGRLRLDQAVVEEISLVRRDGLNVTTLWRERAAALARPPAS